MQQQRNVANTGIIINNKPAELLFLPILKKHCPWIRSPLIQEVHTKPARFDWHR